MAVVVQCYQCNTILELDEGFRGGVCRCSTCGSLLQVPKASTTGAPRARPAAPGASVTDVKRPANPNADTGLSRGQFDPNQQSGQRPAVPDFGGSSSGLRQGRPSAPTATKIERSKPIADPSRPPPHAKEVQKSNALIWLALCLGGLIVAVVVVMVIIFAIKSGNETSPRSRDTKGSENGGNLITLPPDGNQTTPPPVPKVNKGPNFLGIPLVGKKIVLSVDTASSMQDCFDFVRRGCGQAANSLDPSQTIIVALWDDTKVDKVPAGFVSKVGAKQLLDALDRVPVRGATDAEACMKASLGLGGDQVIFVTAKFGLDSTLAAKVLSARKGSERLDSIKLNSEDNPSPFEALAQKTNGKFIFLTQGQLEEAVKP